MPVIFCVRPHGFDAGFVSVYLMISRFPAAVYNRGGPPFSQLTAAFAKLQGCDFTH